MANLAESQVWENGIYQIERTDVVDAGVAGNGIANLQAKLLANRTAYLKQVVDAAGLGTGGLDSDLVAIAQLTTTPFGRAFLTLVDAAAARTYINAQPLDADLTAIAALVTTAFGRSFLEQVDVAAARTYINAQPLDADLTAIAALVTTAFGRGFLGLADAAAARAYISAQAQNINLDSIAALVTTAFGRNLLTLADAAGVRGYLSAQQQDADLDAIAALITTVFGRNLLTVTDATAGRTALGAQTQSADLDAIAALNTAGLIQKTGAGTAAILAATVDGQYLRRNAGTVGFGGIAPSHLPDIGCTVLSSLNQSLANNTMTILAFSSESYDTDNMYTPVANNTRVVISTLGKYLLIGMVQFQANATGARKIQFHVNGGARASTIVNAIAGEPTLIQVSMIASLAAGDFCDLRAVQTSGAALLVEAVGTVIYVQRIG